MQHLDCMRVLLLVAKKPFVSGLRLPAHADAAPQLYAHAAAHCLEACMCCFQQMPAVRAATALRVSIRVGVLADAGSAAQLAARYTLDVLVSGEGASFSRARHNAETAAIILPTLAVALLFPSSAEKIFAVTGAPPMRHVHALPGCIVATSAVSAMAWRGICCCVEACCNKGMHIGLAAYLYVLAQITNRCHHMAAKANTHLLSNMFGARQARRRYAWCAT